MDRRTFTMSSIAACSMMALHTRSFVQSSEAPVEHSTIQKEFRFGEPVEFEMKSVPVKWQGGDVHLVTLNRFTFLLDLHSNRLTARAEGLLLTFDDVDYTIGLVVSDKGGFCLEPQWSSAKFHESGGAFSQSSRLI